MGMEYSICYFVGRTYQELFIEDGVFSIVLHEEVEAVNPDKVLWSFA
jgi:hypothetical protein